MQQQHSQWLTRKVWLNVHLFLALSVGFIFAVLGLTGSLCVYREELDTLLNPQLVVEEVKGEQQSLDQIMTAVRAVHPDRYGEWTLEMPSSPQGMITVWFDKPRETYFERYAPLMVSVNPYTAEVVASRFWGQTLSTWLLDFHSQLHFGDNGWKIIGYCGLLLLISVCSGLYLWWPGSQKVLSVLSIRLTQGWISLVFDLHRLIGLLFAPALLVLAFTGVQLSFPTVLEKLSGTTGMAHGETGRPIVSTAIPNDHPTLIDTVEFIARGSFPKAELRRVTTPDGNSGVYRVNLRQQGEANQRHPYTTVWVDRWSGQVKEVRDPATFNASQTLITWLWPVHTGEALGAWGRFAWFLTGQGLFFLYVSGLIRWLYRKGKIQNKAIDLAGVKHYRQQWGNSIYQLLLKLDDGMTLLAHRLRPLCKRLVEMSLIEFKRGVKYYRAKTKK